MKIAVHGAMANRAINLYCYGESNPCMFTNRFSRYTYPDDHSHILKQFGHPTWP